MIDKAQIKERNYASKYMNEGKDIYLVGINFDEEERNIGGFEWERAENERENLFYNLVYRPSHY